MDKEAAIEAEVRAARERALVPLDIRVKSFKEMLKEKDVSLTFGGAFYLLMDLFEIFCRFQLLARGKRSYTRSSSIRDIYC